MSPRRLSSARAAALPALLALSLPLAGCEIGHKITRQTGYRGAGLQQVIDTKLVAKSSAIPAAPYALPPDTGPTAAQTYQNVRVLGGISAERFNLLMANMNTWIAPPEQGCNYCHNPQNMASDEKYTKVVARRMIQMTLAVNSRWQSHVQQTGVTCWTCHRGNAVPQYKWATAGGTPDSGTIVYNRHGQNAPDPNVGYASLPSDPFARYLRTGATDQIRVASNSEYPDPAVHRASIKDAEASYGLMMHISKSLGVNCTYCHNTQSFRSWTLSRAQRGTAYYGIRMVRDLNDEYLTSLTSVFPNYRKGPHGDPYKVNCMTCHQGLSKPLGGVSMLPDNPMLRGPVAVAAPPPAAAAVQAAYQNPQAITRHQ